MGAKESTTDTPYDDAALREIVEGAESETGDRFFYSLVKHLASALRCEYAFVSELLLDRLRFRTRAVWGRGSFMDNFEVPLDGTPCEAVLAGKSSHHAERICQLFPTDAALKQWGVESYCGVPLLDSAGTVVGHLAILSEQPMLDGPRGLATLRIFAARARAELERLRTEDALRRANEALVQSEERFRDLFDEAPIAYVHEGLDSRFIEANRTAMRILGLKPEEVAGTTGKSLVPDTPDAQRRLSAWIDSMGRGTATTGTVLELRRKNDGKPVWIQCWSRPAPDGSYTRTMFIDVTDRVLMEREKVRLLIELDKPEALARIGSLEEEYRRRRVQMESGFEVIVQANEPTVLPEGKFDRLFEIARQTYLDPRGVERPMLTPEEVRYLSIPKGSLSPDEREQIESHVVHSFNFLLQIPWTKQIREIPRIVRAHHEKLNGTGYPYKLRSDEIPVQAKIMTICDIFDALSASDRPYKKAVASDRALNILEMSVKDQELDPELFRLFLEAKIFNLADKT